MFRRSASVGCVALAALGLLSSCKTVPAPTSDANTPNVYMLAWTDSGNGTQGSQVTVHDAGTYTVDANFLGPNKADIRVYGEENPGVAKLVVAGSGHGVCTTHANSDSQTWTTPGAVSFTVPAQTKTAPSGQVEDFLAVSMDDVLTNISCGMHRYANMPSSEEFFLDGGTVTLNATASNCCGGEGTATFTIEIK